MSWPQNPDDQHASEQPSPAPAPGFGPPPAWTPTGEQPAVTPHNAPPSPGVPQGQPPAPPFPPPGQRPPTPHQPYPPQQPPAGQPYGQQPHGFGAPAGYGTPPAPPAPAAPGPAPAGGGGRKGLYAAIGGVVALAVIGGGAALFLGGGDDKKDKAGPAPSASAAPDTAAPPPAGPGPNTDQQLKPLIAGWQPQANATNHIAYDVPPAAQHWKLGTGSSYVDAAGKPVVAGEGEATYREGGCASADNPNAFGTAGKGQLATAITQGGQGDLGTNAVNVAGNWAFAAYGGKAHKPKISMGTPVPWKHNGIDGYIATAKVTVTYRPSACVPPTAVSRGLAYKGKDGQVHCWVLFADQGVPDALPMADIDKITSTVRPYPAG